MKLSIGIQCVHNRKAVELLYLVYAEGFTQIWKCKLLFVEPREVYEKFVSGEKVRPLHGGVN